MPKYIDADIAPYYLNLQACEQIKSMPTEDVQEVRHGKWKRKNGIFCCSECNYQFETEGYIAFFNYCPNCGAKMDEDGE